jgi:uncharacterized repeat protein (TIGR03803 family)
LHPSDRAASRRRRESLDKSLIKFANMFRNVSRVVEAAVLHFPGISLHGMKTGGHRIGTRGKRILKRAALTLGTIVVVAGAHGAGFTNLYNFGSATATGAAPYGGLLQFGGTLYGTTSSGASGTVFAVNTNGAGFTNLYVFSGADDGANPEAGLLLSANTLYGTCSGGGTNGSGAVFAVNTNNLAFSNLYSFTATTGPLGTNGDGQGPQAPLMLAGGTLYGVAGGGGGGGNGTVFRVNADGSGFTNLHSFGALNFGGGAYTNNDGADPQGGLVLSGGTLYGTTSSGGTNGSGTLFSINTNGAGFKTLHTFSGIALTSTNSDGADPVGGLVASGGSLWGASVNGGSGGNGTIFRINSDGTGFTNLYNFTRLSSGGNTNVDGANPEAALLLSGAFLYGTASLGGRGGNGTIFKLGTNGPALTVLYSFTKLGAASNTNLDGAQPRAGVSLAGSTLYGTAEFGGVNGAGTVFATGALAPIPLGVQRVNQAVVLNWSDPGFTLQAAPSAFGAFTNLPGAASPYTNTVAGSQRFFRLQAN